MNTIKPFLRNFFIIYSSQTQVKYVGEREKTFTTVIYHQHMKKRIPAWEVITNAMCAKMLYRKMSVYICKTMFWLS